MPPVTDSERALHDLCTRSFLSYWSFPNPYRSEGGIAKEICDALVICDKYILAFSDKSIAFPQGDLEVAWGRWLKKSVLASVKQLQGAYRLLRFPQPAIYADHALKHRIRVDTAAPEEREIHLIAVANGATAASQEQFGEPVPTLMQTSDIDAGMPFVLGNVSPKNVFVHVFTDVSLSLVLGEFDTIVDLVKYLRNRQAFFEGRTRFMAAGEEDLIALYFRGHSSEAKDYDMRRALPAEVADGDTVVMDGGFWADMIARPEYRARIEANEVSYLWDGLIEKFTKHQLDGTGISIKPRGMERHEGGLRFMVLEPRVSRRGLSQQIMNAVEGFPEDKNLTARSLVSGDLEARATAYLFMQLAKPESVSYEQYRNYRRHLLEIYSATLLHGRPEVPRVVGIATEPPRLAKRLSEDLLLIDRAVYSVESLEKAVEEKHKLGFATELSSGVSSVQEFPEVQSDGAAG